MAAFSTVTAPPSTTTGSSPSPSALATRTQRELLRWAGAGLIGLIIITVTSAMRGWPFPTLTASPWLFQLSTSNAVIKYAFLLGFFCGVAILCWSWTRLLRLARAGAVSVKQAAVIVIAWTVPLLLAAPLFSGDAYVYLIDGDVLNRGFNPYETGISAMGPADIVYLIHPLWRDTTSMYGPMFMRGMQAIAEVANGDVVAGVLMIRGLVVLSLAVMFVSVLSLAKTYGRPPGEALVFAVLNPITMLHLVGGAHNDGTMVSLLLAGFAVGVKAQSIPWRLVALLLCVAGASFKIPALAGVLVLGWIWAGPGPSFLRRFVGAGLAGLVGGVVFELLTLLSGLGWGWTNALDVPGLAHPLLAPANAVAMAVGGVFGGTTGLNSITRVLATVLSLGLGIFFVLRTGRYAGSEAVLRASGWALLTLAWLGSAVYPWYLSWGIAIVGAVGAKAMDRLLTATIVVVSFLILPGGYGLLDHLRGLPHTVIAVATTAVMMAVVCRIIALNRSNYRLSAKFERRSVGETI